MQITTHSPAQTLALGQLLGQLEPPATTIALHGTLGAGKTLLTRGIALGANVTDHALVSSPTYVLLNIYPGPKPVYHLDAYRIASPDDFAAVGFEELTAPSQSQPGIVIVEWAEKIAPLLPPGSLHIAIQLADAPEDRIFDITAPGAGPAAALLRALAAAHAAGSPLAPP